MEKGDFTVPREFPNSRLDPTKARIRNTAWWFLAEAAVLAASSIPSRSPACSDRTAGVAVAPFTNPAARAHGLLYYLYCPRSLRAPTPPSLHYRALFGYRRRLRHSVWVGNSLNSLLSDVRCGHATLVYARTRNCDTGTLRAAALFRIVRFKEQRNYLGIILAVKMFDVQRKGANRLVQTFAIYFILNR